jgi:hypothetical protein
MIRTFYYNILFPLLKGVKENGRNTPVFALRAAAVRAVAAATLDTV